MSAHGLRAVQSLICTAIVGDRSSAGGETLSVELEQLGEENLHEVLELYRHMHRSDAPLSSEVAVSRWSEMMAMPGHLVFGVRSGADLIGTCVLQIVPNLTRGGRPYGVMENVVVHGDHQRRGVGTAMVGAALDHAWSLGCYKVMLMTGVGNVSAQAFYAQAGFDESAKRAYVARPSS